MIFAFNLYSNLKKQSQVFAPFCRPEIEVGEGVSDLSSITKPVKAKPGFKRKQPESGTVHLITMLYHLFIVIHMIKNATTLA